MIKILIWGCNDFAAHLYYFIKDKISVVAFIDPEKTRKTFCELPVYQPQQLTEDTLTNIPIVLALPHKLKRQVPVCNFETVRQFKLMLRQLTHHYHLQHRLLHPAALVDFLELRFPNKSITFGPPGAGNTLFASLLQTIDRSLKLGHVLTNVSMFFEQLCFEYTQIVHQVISDVIYLDNGHNVHPIPWKVNTTSFRAHLAGEEVNIYAFTTREHFIGSPYSYHHMPDNDLLAKLQAWRFKLFFIVRNPLDNLLSLCNKNAALNRHTGEIDLPIFIQLARWLIDQLEIWQPHLQAMHVLRYEELLDNPKKYLQHMVNLCSAEVALLRPLFKWHTDKTVRKIWQKIAFKQLPNAPVQHFWQGGSGKWEKFFKPLHLAILKAFGVEEVLAQYQYPNELHHFKQRTAGMKVWQDYCTPEVWSLVEKTNVTLDACYEQDADLKTLLNLGKKYTDQVGSLVLNTTSPTLLTHFKQVMAKPFIQQILNAGIPPSANFSDSSS